MSNTTSVAKVVEQLVTSDVGGRATIGTIREAAVQEQGRTPAMQAAKLLADSVEAGDDVVILTGFVIPPTMEPETDGPPGAVSLARALDAGLNANPVIACDPNAIETCKTTATAGGLSVQKRRSARESARSVAVEAFPADRGAAETYAEDLLSLDPAAVVAVEKVGPNQAGVYHNMAGYDVSEETSKVDELYARLDDVPTIAVGDAGNEIGMGVVEERVRKDIEYGATCQCDCGDGIACTISTDVLVPAAVSNWGANGIVTCLGHLLDRQLLHEPSVERRMLVEGAMAGAVDGIGGGTTSWCDGLPTDVNEAVVRLLREVPSASVHDRGGGELTR
jgi:hypothetical protein